MKNSDLRIGNLLSYVIPSAICRVEYIKPDLIGSSPIDDLRKYNAERGIEDFKPILISEEWLLKLGFERTFFKGRYVWVNKSHYMFLDCTYHIIVKESGFVAFSTFGCFLRQVQTVHELQNLYFALIGDELSI